MKWFVMVLITVLAACDGGTSPDELSVTGRWVGQTTYGDSARPVELRLSLVDNSGTVKGNGELEFVGLENGKYDVMLSDGLRDGRSVVLDMWIASYYYVQALGSLTGDKQAVLDLGLRGSGFKGERVKLVKGGLP